MKSIGFLRQMLAAGCDLDTAMQAAEAFEGQLEENRDKLVSAILDRLAAPRAVVGTSRPLHRPTAAEVAAHDNPRKRSIYRRALKDPIWVDAPPTRRLPAAEWWSLVKHVRERDGHKCTYCGASSEITRLHCDHVVPLAAGGENDEWNLVTACEGCNLSKGAKYLLDWSVPTWIGELGYEARVLVEEMAQ